MLIHCDSIQKYSSSSKRDKPKRPTNHLQSPNSPDPHLQRALHTLHVLQLDTLPPASSGGFPPEEKQFLGHGHGRIACGCFGGSMNVSAKTCERNAANDCLVGLASAVTPAIVTVEATISLVRLFYKRNDEESYPAVNISIRCCSVVPGSSLFLSPLKMPSCFNNALPAARLTSSISGWSISRLGGMA
jgi:hypothetical protein